MAEPDASGAGWAEAVNAVVIAVSGLLIAFASYQADLWGGEESVGFSRANILYTEAARTWGRAAAQQTVEVQLFSQWLDAAVHKDASLAAFYADRVPTDAREAFRAWLALDPLRNPAAPSSPMAMPQYAPSGPIQAKALERQGDAAFREGRHAKRVADSFSQAGTVLSTALFFAGIGQVFRARTTRSALLVMALVACALGVLRLVTLPAMTLFATAG